MHVPGGASGAGSPFSADGLAQVLVLDLSLVGGGIGRGIGSVGAHDLPSECHYCHSDGNGGGEHDDLGDG